MEVAMPCWKKPGLINHSAKASNLLVQKTQTTHTERYSHRAHGHTYIHTYIHTAATLPAASNLPGIELETGHCIVAVLTDNLHTHMLGLVSPVDVALAPRSTFHQPYPRSAIVGVMSQLGEWNMQNFGRSHSR
jgi:hypothetical protein